MRRKIDIDRRLATAKDRSKSIQKFDYEALHATLWNGHTIRRQDRMTEWYNKFIDHEEIQPNYKVSSESFELPPVAVLKRFAHFYAEICRTESNLSESEDDTSDSQDTDDMKKDVRSYRTITGALSMITGSIKRVHDMSYTKAQIHDVHGFVKKNLVRSGVVTTDSRDKFSFGPAKVAKIQNAVWTSLDPNSNSLTARSQQPRSGRMLILGNALAWFYVIFGARISAVLPRYMAANPQLDENQAFERLLTGIRYGDIQVKILRMEEGSELVMTFAQRYIKDNWDTKNRGIKTWGVFRSHFLQDCLPFVLALAFANDAFEHVKSPAELFNLTVPEDLLELPVRWKDHLTDRYIFTTDMEGRTALSQQVWDRIFKSMSRQAGYYAPVTVHRMRQAVTNNVSRSGATPSQHKHALGQTVAVFDTAYIDSITSLDMQAIAHGGEPARNDIVERLTGPDSQYIASGFQQLTLERRAQALREDKKLQSIERKLIKETRADVMKALRNKISARKRAVIQKAQVQYMKENHEARITMAIKPGVDIKDTVSFADARFAKTMLFMPEHQRLAQVVKDSNLVHGNTERLKILNDLVLIAKQQKPEAYRPGEAPSNGSCGFCNRPLSDDISRNWIHIHNCHQSHLEKSNGVRMTYCLFCLQWLSACDYGSHIEKNHLSHVTMDCGVFCLTKGLLISPGLCPFCLGNQGLDDRALLPQSRMQPFTSRHDLALHIVRHFENCAQKLIECPHGLCSMVCKDRLDLARHFERQHGIDDLLYQISDRTCCNRPDLFGSESSDISKIIAFGSKKRKRV